MLGLSGETSLFFQSSRCIPHICVTQREPSTKIMFRFSPPFVTMSGGTQRCDLSYYQGKENNPLPRLGIEPEPVRTFSFCDHYCQQNDWILAKDTSNEPSYLLKFLKKSCKNFMSYNLMKMKFSFT